MKCSSLKKLSLWLSALFTVLFSLEKLSYVLSSLHWFSIACNTKSCMRILLVADPQLIGYQNEVVHFLTPLAVYDSDNYLHNTYSYAYDFVKPDVVVFLGDLFDEGSTASDEEYGMYVRRLLDVFEIGQTSPNTRHIWLPGDNDIGGEGMDFVTSDKVRRFNRAFSQPELITVKNTTFFKINGILKDFHKVSPDTKNVIVGLSHFPVLFKPSLFTNRVLDVAKPHLIFAGHEHKSMIVSTDRILTQTRHIIPITPSNNEVFTFNLALSEIYEVLLPPCSYRMGTDKIGYGFAVIENKEFRYTVLWCPSRFFQLGLYVVIALLFLFIFIKIILLGPIRSKRKVYRIWTNPGWGTKNPA